MVNPINHAATPQTGTIDSDAVVAPTGDPLQDVMLLQYQTFQSLRLDERQNQLALREQQLDAIDEAYRHAVSAVRARKNSSLLNAAVSGASLAVGAYAEVSGNEFLKDELAERFVAEAPKLTEKFDGAFGFAADALDEDLDETSAKNEADLAGQLRSDATDRLEEWRRLQARTIELMETIQNAKNKGDAAKIS